ncbi:hypothetical protein ACWC2H_40080, partial [Streptomyces sp. 900105755]
MLRTSAVNACGTAPTGRRAHPGLSQCTARTPACEATSARSAALACHARTDALPGHLRTCQCRAQGCRWHPRHRGCAGPVLLALTQGRGG